MGQSLFQVNDRSYYKVIVFYENHTNIIYTYIYIYLRAIPLQTNNGSPKTRDLPKLATSQSQRTLHRLLPLGATQVYHFLTIFSNVSMTTEKFGG